MLRCIQRQKKDIWEKMQEILEGMKPLPGKSRCSINRSKRVRQKLIFLILTLSTSKEDVQHMDFAPESEEDQLTYKYNCPVCLRYFDKILAGKCCGNYLCHLCIGDFIQMADRNKHYKMRCPMCNHEELNLQDVNPDEEVKKYGNTFISAKNLKETLKGICDNDDKIIFMKMSKFLEQIQLRQASSANNFYPSKLDTEFDSKDNIANLQHSLEQKNKTLQDFDKIDVEGLGINIITSHERPGASNDSINYRDDLEEQKDMIKMSPHKSIFSLKGNESGNLREILSDHQETKMKDFNDQNQEDNRAYIDMSNNT
ncbi:unnamed protein product [Moneuplotes crassus]|uniref:RING-type domain-containing protein n=1 Tax=Euplotes crassus TaxID=5936 RepID=A0AAD2CYW0_EUPCR|nr:unnamed protein product [Moneuplotes crassus]